MDNGDVYVAAPDIDLSALSIDQRYAVTYQKMNGKKVATFFESQRDFGDKDTSPGS